MSDKEIITGFSLDIDAVELAKYAQRRAGHHKSRADLYEEEVEKIAAIKKGDDTQEQLVSKFANNADPVAELDKSAKNHRKRERFFAFAAEHFSAGATYRLAVTDLTVLEILPARY